MATKTFAYEAIDVSGALLKGTIESDSPEAAANSLAEQKLVPLSVAGTGQGMHKELKIPGIGGRTGLKDLAIMSRQFASMTASGLTMIRALSILEDQATKPKLRRRARPDPQPTCRAACRCRPRWPSTRTTSRR